MKVVLEIQQPGKKCKRTEMILPDINSMTELRPVFEAEQVLNKFFEPGGVKILVYGA